MRAMVAAVAAMLALAGAVMVMADGNNCRGTENTYPVWSGSPVFVRNNSHASLYTATDSFGRQVCVYARLHACLHVYSACVSVCVSVCMCVCVGKHDASAFIDREFARVM
jgi:hypothetical protein